MQRESLTLTLVVALTLSRAAFASGFDWSGNSDVYLQQSYGKQGAKVAMEGANLRALSVGWGYRFYRGFFIDGFLRDRQQADLGLATNPKFARISVRGSGYGLGLGYRGRFWRTEAGYIRDYLQLSTFGSDQLVPLPDKAGVGSTWEGAYARAGLDLFRWSHLLFQAHVQIESQKGRGSGYELERAASHQYLASAGLSIHATDINSLIPSATVITALLVAACIKDCRGNFWNFTPDFPTSRGSFTRHTTEEDDKSEDQENKNSGP